MVERSIVDAYWLMDAYYQVLVDGRDSGGAYSTVRLILPMGRPVSVPEHRHDRVQEVLYVESGLVEVQIDGREVLLKAGEQRVIPAGQAHGLRARGPAMASVLLRFEPAGIEDLVRALGRRVETAPMPTADEATEQCRLVRERAAHFDIHLS